MISIIDSILRPLSACIDDGFSTATGQRHRPSLRFSQGEQIGEKATQGLAALMDTVGRNYSIGSGERRNRKAEQLLVSCMVGGR